MAGGGFFRGTSVDQDSRYFNQDKKILAKMVFPDCFSERVDLAKVQQEVIHQWVTERLTALLGFEDDIVVAMVINLLEPKAGEPLDPRNLQMALTGFLAKDAAPFAKELWELLLSAQANPTGIPTAILDKKKRELEKVAADRTKLRQVLDAKRAESDGRQSTREKEGPDGGSAAPQKRSPPRRQTGFRPRERDTRDDGDRKRSRSRDTGKSERRSRSPDRARRRRRDSHPSRSRSRSRPRSRRDRQNSASRSRSSDRRSRSRRTDVRHPRRRRSRSSSSADSSPKKRRRSPSSSSSASGGSPRRRRAHRRRDSRNEQDRFGRDMRR